MLYLDDLHIGDRFASREYEMTLEQIHQFAKLYDPQPFHLDEQKAAQHPIFLGLAASGWHTSAVVMRLWTECFPIAGGLLGTESNLRWPRPTRVGDRGIVSYVTQALNQHGDVLLISDTKILVFRKSTI